MLVNDIAKRLNVDDNKVRRYAEEFSLGKRDKNNNYRIFDENDCMQLRIIFAFSDIGLDFDLIKTYLKEPTNPLIFASIIERTHRIENALNIVRETMEKFTYPKL